MARRPAPRAFSRAERAFLDVLPAAVRPLVVTEADAPAVVVAGQRVGLTWVGEGNLGEVRRALAAAPHPDVVVGRRLSPGAREALAQAGVSWADETGAAEVALGTIVVSRTGRTVPAGPRPARWAPATLAVAEGLLCGVPATVAATQAATGLSSGSCTTALRTLTDLGLLEADAARGRAAGRRVVDPGALLAAYADAADALRPPERLAIGVTWRDPVAGLAELGRSWTSAGIEWCATGAVAAAILAPHLTQVGAAEVYVDAHTLAGLEAVAAEARLKPIEGGRLTLRPLPTLGVRRLAIEEGGLRLAPWPRVYTDLRTIGVRGEEAAEHLLEVVHARRS
jgi:hypothetical protein